MCEVGGVFFCPLIIIIMRLEVVLARLLVAGALAPLLAMPKMSRDSMISRQSATWSLRAQLTRGV